MRFWGRTTEFWQAKPCQQRLVLRIFTMTTTIEIKGKLTKEQCDTITAAAGWIERISNRKEELPKLFMDNLDPAPIGKKLRQMVKENDKVDGGEETEQGILEKINNVLTAAKRRGEEPKYLYAGKKEVEEIKHMAASGTTKQGKDLLFECCGLEVREIEYMSYLDTVWRWDIDFLPDEFHYGEEYFIKKTIAERDAARHLAEEFYAVIQAASLATDIDTSKIGPLPWDQKDE